jgi:hypothetical protein
MTTLAALSQVSQLPAPGPARPEPGATPEPGFEAELQRTSASTSRLVGAQRTPLTGTQAAAALEDAWKAVTGDAPDKSTVAVLAAHWAHETGRGQSMLNFNFAGIKGTGPSGLSAAYGTREGWGAKEVHVVDNFRAYRTAEEGARDYVALLARRYPDAVDAAKNGDPTRFVHALKERGYFTGNEAAYVRSVSTLTQQALASGFDAMGTAAVAGPTSLGSEESTLSRAMDFRGAVGVPFDSSMVQGAPSVDPSSFYDAIARATLRIAGEPEGARETSSIL